MHTNHKTTNHKIYKVQMHTFIMKMDFENLTIGELRRITEEFKRLTLDFKTAEDYLEERSAENANKEI